MDIDHVLEFSVRGQSKDDLEDRALQVLCLYLKAATGDRDEWTPAQVLNHLEEQGAKMKINAGVGDTVRADEQDVQLNFEALVMVTFGY